MKKMNWYFYKVWIPLQVVTIFSLVGIAVGSLEVNWWLVFLTWFLMGPVGTGVGYHRLFSHRQFTTWKPIEHLLALFGTLSAYAPVLFWASQHQYHHRVSDTKDDPSSPIEHGFWESYLWWRMRESVLKQIDLRSIPTRMMLKDPVIMFLSKHFTKIIYIFAITLALIDLNLLVSLFVIPSFIEHQRVNLVSSISHLKIPFSYKNFESKDNGQNNIFMGYLTMGFGWHNNHHARPRKLVNHERWWEVDVEGIIGWLLTKKST
jgi:stearoyl-CoA desaturase (delta-9 desaturase)